MTFIYSRSLLPNRPNKGYYLMTFIYLHFLLPEKSNKGYYSIMFHIPFSQTGQTKGIIQQPLFMLPALRQIINRPGITIPVDWA